MSVTWLSMLVVALTKVNLRLLSDFTVKFLLIISFVFLFFVLFLDLVLNILLLLIIVIMAVVDVVRICHGWILFLNHDLLDVSLNLRG